MHDSRGLMDGLEEPFNDVTSVISQESIKGEGAREISL